MSELKPTQFKLSQDDLTALENIRLYLEQANPGLRPTRTDALRFAIRENQFPAAKKNSKKSRK